jgi:predicted PurR-regulated permease PerM
MNRRFFERADSLAIVAVLVIACLKVITPLPGALLWRAIIAISTWPLFERLQRQLRGRSGFDAFIYKTSKPCVAHLP